MRLTTVVALFLLAGCGSDDSGDPARLSELNESAASLSEELNTYSADEPVGLKVVLSFRSDVDLDLYVTGPLAETVYFANHTSKSGGEISRDVRCDSEDPRIEEVVFNSPIPGRYRVGVDFPARCSGDPAAAAYAVLVKHPGEELRKTGVVQLEQFDVAVLEFEIGDKYKRD
jgi:hypothetical protein